MRPWTKPADPGGLFLPPPGSREATGSLGRGSALSEPLVNVRPLSNDVTVVARRRGGSIGGLDAQRLTGTRATRWNQRSRDAFGRLRPRRADLLRGWQLPELSRGEADAVGFDPPRRTGVT